MRRRLVRFVQTKACNSAGIYHLQEDLRFAVFGSRSDRSSQISHEEIDALKKLEQLSLSHLKANNLLNQETSKPKPVPLRLPQLLGNNIDEHFQKIGQQMCTPYLDICEAFSGCTIPKLQDVIDGSDLQLHPGWTRYAKLEDPTPVAYPPESVIVFDVETLPSQTQFPVMATAVSDKYWYVWLNPWLLDSAVKNPNSLIPLGNHLQVVIGHNVGFDRKRVLEEYSVHESKKWFMDTMSFHIASSGMCNQQRLVYAEYMARTSKIDKLSSDLVEQDEATRLSTNRQIKKLKSMNSTLLASLPWLSKTCGNSLSSCVKFYLGLDLNKDDRNIFVTGNRDDFNPELTRKLILYCALDSYYTKNLFDVVFPKFLKKNSHPVSRGALQQLSQVFLPISSSWTEYVDTCEKYYENKQQEINSNLHILAEDAVGLVPSLSLHDESSPSNLHPQVDAKAHSEFMSTISSDPWLRQLDWDIKPLRYTKGTAKQPPRLAKNQKMPGKPKWYKDLFVGNTMKLFTRMRTAVLLLRLKFDAYPLVWSDKDGWCFDVPQDNASEYMALNFTIAKTDKNMISFKLPHPDGADARCTNPFAKFYLSYFDSGQISSENKLAANALVTNLECSYWISARQRIFNQMPVFFDDLANGDVNGRTKEPCQGFILPCVAPMGAVTRRAVEDTWLTASNAKKNRLGSELKSKVEAPEGYSIVGADVDSEELWIASVVGDSTFKMHGASALGWMTLEGTKNAGTDLHSKSAEILGISRNEAKVFNYGRIYGAGKASASRKLRQFNPSLSLREAEKKAEALYTSTKGVKVQGNKFALNSFYCGGTESVIFNQLALLASQPRQKTPILGSEITDALANVNLNAKKQNMLTTRVNWTIQSSGVDYLHLLVASMYYLTRLYNIDARLMLTVHDEVRYLVKEEDKYRASLALQVSNLWTRAMFCQQLGFEDIPANIAFFSLVDIDHILRKEVTDGCVTPTQQSPIKEGECLSIYSLLDKCDDLGAPNEKLLQAFRAQKVVPRNTVLSQIDIPYKVEFAEAQINDPTVAKSMATLATARNRKAINLPPIGFRTRV